MSCCKRKKRKYGLLKTCQGTFRVKAVARLDGGWYLMRYIDSPSWHARVRGSKIDWE